jgi:methionyl-tRNA formyltransferase
MVGRPPLRVIVFGTPAFALATLDALLASRHPVVGVVTQPDRPRGRGQKTTMAPVKARAVACGLPVLQPATLSDDAFLDALAVLGADIGVVAAYGKILSDRVLAIPPLGMVNVHASLLPRYRGAAPVHRAVVAGERETGVTIMRVVKALDAGPMLAKAARPISGDETSTDVERDLSFAGARLLVETLDRLTAGAVEETPQDDGAATYAPRLTKEDGRIDWTMPASRVHDLVRGLHPWPHAYAFLNGQRFIMLRTFASSEPAEAPPGGVVTARGDQLRIAAGQGSLLVAEIQAEGGRPMTAREFLAGHRLAPGDVFSARP